MFPNRVPFDCFLINGSNTVTNIRSMITCMKMKNKGGEFTVWVIPYGIKDFICHINEPKKSMSTFVVMRTPISEKVDHERLMGENLLP